MTSIWGDAFTGCSALTSITIPDSVTSIGGYVFSYCKSLTSVTIPGGLATISNNAFKDCSSLKTVIYSGSKAQWEEITIDATGNEPLTRANLVCISAVLSTEQFTNLVEINIDASSATLSEVGYVYSASEPDKMTAKSVFADSNFVSVTADSNGAYKITADTNGYYSIAVKGSYDGIEFAACLERHVTNLVQVGDVLLNDGSIVPYDADNLSFTDEQKEKAVGVLYGFDEDGKPLGWLGIYNSAGETNSGNYIWAPKDTTGYNTQFTDIICTSSASGSGAASTTTFTGDTDGSDNWAYICSVDPEGTANAAENYPAFNYVNNYASTFGLTGGYATGWYMPSIAELCYIYRSKVILNSVLSGLDGIQLYSASYWSSSQYGNSDNYAGVVNFSDGFVSSNGKDSNRYVCCVRSFSE